MSEIAIIGGTGLTKMDGLTITSREIVKTPYGVPSAPLTHGTLHGREVTFLARHGQKHSIPPHLINYRANLWALKSVGVKQIFAVGAVGGIADDCAPTTIVVPDQIIDYTYGREHTLFDSHTDDLDHIGFSFPYSEELRQRLLAAASQVDVKLVSSGTYGITQGPRLETAAEIKRMHNDGCTIVGMTGMPEAALARELGLEYAVITMVVNWGAGIEPEEINFSEVEGYIQQGAADVKLVFENLFSHWT